MYDYFLTIDKTKFEKFGSFSWSDDIETYSTIIKFSSKTKFNLGRQFILNNGSEKVFKGIITDLDYDRDLTYNYIAYDYGFYLGKNEISFQAKGEIESEIKRLLLSVQIPAGTIQEIKGTVDEPFKKKTVKEILQKLLELSSAQTGNKYVVDCSLGVVDIKPVYKLTDLKGELAKGFTINSAENLGNIKISASMQELKNRIRIYLGDKDFIIASDSGDPSSIGKYGLLQEVVVPDQTAKNYSIITANKLIEKNRTTTTINNVEFLGEDRIKKGVIIPIRDTVTNIVGDYLVKTSSHKIENGVHTVNCAMELYS